MNDYPIVIIGLLAFAVYCCYVGYQKISMLENRLLQVEIQQNFVEQTSEKAVVQTEIELPSSKRLKEINELKKLGKYISSLMTTTDFIESCLKKIKSEIDIQERIYFKELGEDTYKNSQELNKISNN
jgi:hypothetical protein